MRNPLSTPINIDPRIVPGVVSKRMPLSEKEFSAANVKSRMKFLSKPVSTHWICPEGILSETALDFVRKHLEYIFSKVTDADSSEASGRKKNPGILSGLTRHFKLDTILLFDNRKEEI